MARVRLTLGGAAGAATVHMYSPEMSEADANSEKREFVETVSDFGCAWFHDHNGKIHDVFNSEVREVRVVK